MLRAPITNENVRYLETWATVNENTAAKNNPLATTRKTRNSYDLPGNAALNNGIGVQQYPSIIEGARATASTLLNGYYGPIVNALRTGRPYTYQAHNRNSVSLALQTWSGSGYTYVPAAA